MPSSHQRLRALSKIAALALLALPLGAQTRYHVDAGAPAGGDGLSWAGAFQSPDDALELALVGDKVWVKAGTYASTATTDPLDPRTATFFVRPGVKLYGGFDGTETTLAERAGLFEQTILTGEQGVVGDPTDNAYQVVTALHPSGIPPGASRVDGFTIRDGYGVGGGQEQGGGVRMFNLGLWLVNCTIRDNTARWGAGLHGQPAAVNLRWCKFIDNHALERGGGIWGQAISYRISHCVFEGNTAARGGGLYLHSIGDDIPGAFPRVMVHNSLFFDNVAERGGAIYLGGGEFSSGKLTLSSSTIAYNRATIRGGGIHAVTGSQVAAESRIYNSIVWFNSAPTDPNLRGRHDAMASNIQDGIFSGLLNVTVHPGFVDGAQRDLRLRAGSLCNDTGLNALLPMDFLDVDGDGDWQETVPIDLDGRRRINDDPAAPPFGPLVDMGAYER